MKKLIIKNLNPAGPMSKFESKLSKAAKEWGKTKTEEAKSEVKKSEENAKKSHTIEVNNKKGVVKSAYSDNIRTLQENLYKMGAFQGIKNKKGQQVSFKEAVDGIDGSMTKQALANARKNGLVSKDNGLLALNVPSIQVVDSPNIVQDKGVVIPEGAKEWALEINALKNADLMYETMHGNDKSSQLPIEINIKDNDNLNDALIFTKNLLKNPRAATTDAILSVADKIGAPSNATNYLRDLNVSLPYRASSAIRAGWNTITDNDNFSKNYTLALANPSWYEKTITINPIPVRNSNFNDEELKILEKASDKGSHNIDNADIHRVSGSYGSTGSLSKMFTPDKVAQLAIGRASGGNGEITDVFDFNTEGDKAQKDNNAYLNLALKNPGFNYESLRAITPYVNTIDVMPDEYKILSRLKFL